MVNLMDPECVQEDVAGLTELQSRPRQASCVQSGGR